MDVSTLIKTSAFLISVIEQLQEKQEQLTKEQLERVKDQFNKSIEVLQKNIIDKTE